MSVVRYFKGTDKRFAYCKPLARRGREVLAQQHGNAADERTGEIRRHVPRNTQARSSVHLEYFNFRNDSIANMLFDLLAEKAKEGVEVRALFDAFGTLRCRC
mgnify:CR=1 FL=1